MTQSAQQPQQMATKQSLGEMQQQVLPLAVIRGERVVEKPQDLFIPPDALEIVLEAFEGPLDLLLYLIRKQKFDIVDLPIATITRQYMEYVELMKTVKLELAVEYLVMAAILAEIKSRLLLPKQTINEEEEDPRAELIRRLQEYEVIKDASQKLDALPRLERDIHVAQTELSSDFQPLIHQVDVDLADLVNAFQAVLKRTQAFEHHHIHKEILSTRDRMASIVNLLVEKSPEKQTASDDEFVGMFFTELFSQDEGKQGVIVTFLAMLELMKAGTIRCIQSSLNGQIQVVLSK